MEALLLALFALGVGVGLLARAVRPQQKPRARSRQNDSLDTIDEMFLYGEVNNDDFYGM